MLQTLKLTNFKRHQSLSVSFTEGIQVIRGGNEGGKSSTLHAIAYALFGAKSLALSVDETVTWGEDPRTLKVELTFTSGGKVYTVTRSKAGAEVILDGKVFCTGQNEVSSLCALLLGADSATASKLMFASQNGIRGALEEGPKALSVLIEELAGFSVIDNILENASRKLALGSPSLLEERMKGAKSTLEAATESLPPKPDKKLHKETLIKLDKEIKDAEESVEPLQKASDELAERCATESDAYLGRVALERSVQGLIQSVKASSEQVAACLVTANMTVDESKVESLKAQIAEAESYETRQKAHQKFLALPETPTFPSQSSFEEGLSQTSAKVKSLSSEIAEKKTGIAVLKGQRINHDKCDKCGQDITHLDNVKETNARIDKEVSLLEKQIEATEKAYEKTVERESALSLAREQIGKYQAACRGLDGFTEVDESVFPATLSWKGTIPASSVPDSPKVELAALEAKIKSVAAAKAKLELATEQHTKASADLEVEMEKLKTSTAPDADAIRELTRAKTEAAQAVKVAEGAAIIARKAKEDAIKDFDHALQLWDANRSRVEDAEKTIAACQSDLDSLDYNNALVKKLRAVRPVIANRLWNTVLASVSVMFSQMRGEASTVTKAPSGFQVNGQAVEALSGSTLDILGIALRCAMLRTFIPDCGLLILDEPAQGMDNARTEAMLGFLQMVKMQQTLLVTHEDVSATIASNIIEL